MKIKRGDLVKIMQGKDRGREGKVKKVLPKDNKIIVDGINIAKKHVKPRGKDQKGGIIKVERPLHASKVMVICPSCGQPTRIGYQVDKKGEKYRICRKCETVLSTK